jgi:hypothetical protein
MDFSDFWHEVTYQNSKTSHRARFLKKGLDHSKIAKNCVFWPFLAFFGGNSKSSGKRLQRFF